MGATGFSPYNGFSNIGTNKQRLSFATKVVKGSTPSRKTQLEFYSNYGSEDWYTISNVKIERGNKATDWSPAPEDVEADATAKANKALADAKADAKTKADAAQSAAQTYALAQAQAEKVKAQAYADGKVTAEEKARIADVNAKLATAKTDAQTKATAAQNAAQTYAKAQADAALASAKKDAKAQADAAKTHAENFAKVEVIDATTKRFVSPASHNSTASAVTGYLIIETPITSARMVKLNITGYNYQVNKSNIDLSIGFYFNGAFHNFDLPLL